jgi:hypothetical protein
MWIATDDIGCCHYQIYSDMWIGKYVTGKFHEQYDVLCELEQIVKNDVMT